MFKYFIKFCFLLLPFLPNNAQAFYLASLLDYQATSFYVGAFGGIGGGYDLDCRDVKTNRGYYFGINGGKEIFQHLRLEGDVMWQGNDVNGIKLGTIQLEHAKGTIDIGSIMANVIYDFNFPFPGSPSLGAGIGYAYADGDWSGKLTQTNGNFFIEKQVKESFKKNGFAWQIIADLNFFICCGLKLSIEYRFFKLDNKISNHKFGLALVKFF